MTRPLSYDALLAGTTLPRLEARALLEAAAARPREWLIAHGDEPAHTHCIARHDALVARRLAGEPLAYLLGEREFYGRQFIITPEVLIPRIDTEVLAAWAIANAPPAAQVLELGTGSGALAITLALARPDLHIVATDLSDGALRVARRNAARLGAGSVQWQAGHWWRAVEPDRRFDLVVSNPPYLAHDDPHLTRGDLRFEPPMALVAGDDGLLAYREIFDEIGSHLAPGGTVVVEHGHTQAPAVQSLLSRAGLQHGFTRTDDAGLPRITGATWGASLVHDPSKGALTAPPADP